MGSTCHKLSHASQLFLSFPHGSHQRVNQCEAGLFCQRKGRPRAVHAAVTVLSDPEPGCPALHGSHRSLLVLWYVGGPERVEEPQSPPGDAKGLSISRGATADSRAEQVASWIQLSHPPAHLCILTGSCRNLQGHPVPAFREQRPGSCCSPSRAIPSRIGLPHLANRRQDTQLTLNFR